MVLLWVLPPSPLHHPLLLFFSCCRCSFRVSGSGCSPYLVCQRSLPYWDLSEEEKIQCTCSGRRFSWKLTAMWRSKIAGNSQHSPEQTKSLPEFILMCKLVFEENLVPVKRENSLVAEDTAVLMEQADHGQQ